MRDSTHLYFRRWYTRAIVTVGRRGREDDVGRNGSCCDQLDVSFNFANSALPLSFGTSVCWAGGNIFQQAVFGRSW